MCKSAPPETVNTCRMPWSRSICAIRCETFTALSSFDLQAERASASVRYLACGNHSRLPACSLRLEARHAVYCAAAQCADHDYQYPSHRRFLISSAMSCGAVNLSAFSSISIISIATTRVAALSPHLTLDGG